MVLPRVILHADMDAFYASVEQRDFPELRNRPIIVGGSSRRMPQDRRWMPAKDYPSDTRGVVTTASYEARRFGVRSAIPLAQACKLCPQALVVAGRMSVYVEVSRQVRAIFMRYTPDVEPMSLDEAFLDLTNVPRWSAQGVAGGRAAAEAIRRDVRQELRLPVSVGVAPNKFLAKIGSDLAKPDGLCVIRAEDAAAVLAPLPATVIFGIGKVAAERLRLLGIHTVADLLRADDQLLVDRLGTTALEWKSLAGGRDDRPVRTSRRAKSIGKERTFGADVGSVEELRSVLLSQVEHVARELREDGLRARTVTLKLRRPDFKTFTRSATLADSADRTDVLWSVAERLLNEFFSEHSTTLRLIGFSVHELAEESERGLFESPIPDRSKADIAADAVVAKLGKDAIRRGGSSA